MVVVLAMALSAQADTGTPRSSPEFAAGAARTEARELTLDESVRLGLAQNARRRAATADAEAAAAQAKQALADRLPTVRAQAGYTRLSSGIPNATVALPGFETITLQRLPLDQYRAVVSAEQTVFLASREQTIRAARHDATAAERRARQQDADLAFEIRRAFWELRRATAARDALASALERVDAHLSDVTSRLREGAALQRDLLSAQTRRSEVRLERLEADNAVRVAQLELCRLLGLPLDTTVRPVVASEEPDAAAVRVIEDAGLEEDLTAAALAGRPELLALDEDVAALRARVRAARGERWPQVDLVGLFVEAQPNAYFFVEQDRFHWNWELGLSARWNVWDGGRRQARESELASRLQAAEARLAEARTQVAVDVARRQLEVSRAQEATLVAAQNVAEAQESFRVARRQFQEGASRASDVLAAEDAWRRAEARRAQAEADHATATAAVRNALGQVW